MSISNMLRRQNNQNSVDPPRSDSDVIPDADASSPELLCQPCQKIDWDNVSSFWWSVLDSLGDSSRGTVVLRTFTASRTQLLDSSCRICRLVGHLKDQDPRFPICRLEISEISTRIINRGGEKSGENKMAVRSMRAYPSALINSERLGVVRNLVAHSFSPSNAPVKHIEPLSIDFQRFKWMIQNCCENHRQCRSLVGGASGLRLIQVETGKIVKAEADCKYVALSYVWGKEPPSQKESDSFPLVIRDAILATQHLGCRYLWVDRYCIDQGSEHKKQMINQMDRVYSNAFVTIVAAAGSDASAGLAGISRPRQKKQGQATVGRTHLTEVWDDGYSLVANSTWASRGWTYQEGYLSPRCLIFTDREVIYLCNFVHATETRTTDYDEIKKVLKRFHWIIPPEKKSDYLTVINHVGPQIEEYSARVLSNEDDSLNAFLGILKHYESHAENPAEAVLHLWGITTWITDLAGDEIQFDVLWRHKDVTISRRPGFPSWSWVGWSGAIEYVSNAGHKALILPPRLRKQNAPGPIEKKQPGIEDTAWNIHIYNGDQLCELSDFCRLEAQRSSQPKELWVTALVLGMRFREVGSKICATFPIRHDTFVAVPVFFDRPFDPAIHTLGFILPRGGGRTYNHCCMYNVIILQKVGEDRFERAGIVDVTFSKWLGTLKTRGQVVLNAQDDQIEAEVKLDDYLFLSNSKKMSFWLV